MSEPAGAHGAPALLLRVSVPAGGGFRHVVRELATKVAEYMGSAKADAERVAAALERLAASVAPPDGADHDKDIVFEFREGSRELVMQARCAGRSSEVRHRLPE